VIRLTSLLRFFKVAQAIPSKPLYHNGQGVVKDERKALEWYQKAANQGNMDAKEGVQKLKSKLGIR